MTAIAAINCYDAEILLKAATIACAMSIEALHGTDRFLYDKIHIARNIKGQMVCANNIRNLIKKSEIIVSHRDCPKVQDAYSLRCLPQVIGVFHEVLKFCIGIVVKEMNSACDNPLIFDDKILSCGNFHGEPIAQAMDFFAISISEVGNISERRIFRYQDSKLSGLPACLIENSGLNNGFMITQYTAASLVSENKVLCHPASVDSIPSAADQEDHVSMGTIAAVKAIKVLKNVKHIVSIELLNAAQALDFRKPSLPGKGTKMAVDFIRKELCIPFIQCDLSLAGFIDKTYNNIENLVNYVEDKIPLKI
jgi:histidine ammonia-lyase